MPDEPRSPTAERDERTWIAYVCPVHGLTAQEWSLRSRDGKLYCDVEIVRYEPCGKAVERVTVRPSSPRPEDRGTLRTISDTVRDESGVDAETRLALVLEIVDAALSDHGSLGHGVATEEADDNDHLWHDPEAANRAKRSDQGSEG